jgi:hypothetical protein
LQNWHLKIFLSLEGENLLVELLQKIKFLQIHKDKWFHQITQI